MHIPDGFLSLPVAAATYGISAAIGAATIVQAKRRFSDRFVPLAGISAAFIFAAQMVNFPIGGGTSGHFLGAMLACLLLGPSVGFWIMTLVLAMQALVFADGGITALGANVLNMGIVGGIIPYAIFAFSRQGSSQDEGPILSSDLRCIMAGRDPGRVCVQRGAWRIGDNPLCSGDSGYDGVSCPHRAGGCGSDNGRPFVYAQRQAGSGIRMVRGKGRAYRRGGRGKWVKRTLRGLRKTIRDLS